MSDKETIAALARENNSWRDFAHDVMTSGYGAAVHSMARLGEQARELLTLPLSLHAQIAEKERRVLGLIKKEAYGEKSWSKVVDLICQLESISDLEALKEKS